MACICQESRPDVLFFCLCADVDATGLVAWLQGELNTKDASATVTGQPSGGLDYVDGLIGAAFDTTRTKNAGIIIDSAALDLGQGSFSIDFWQKRDGRANSSLLMWSDGIGRATELSILSSGRYYSFRARRVLNGSVSDVRPGTVAADDNTWEHVAVTYDHSSGEAVVYIDGAPAATASIGIGPLLTDLPLYIGYDPVENRSFNGQLDEISFYQRVLAPTEVAEIASSSVFGKCPLPAQNAAPLVNAGFDRTLEPSFIPVTLNGSVGDDGLPMPSTLTTLWEQVSGPPASILEPDKLQSAATLPEVGTYVFRLSANDGLADSADTVTFVVSPIANRAPVVEAGESQSVFVDDRVTLSGLVSDDGLPAGSLGYQWSQVDGPNGGADIASPDAATTSVAFSQTGTYRFQLTVSDGILSGVDQVVVTVSALPRVALVYPDDNRAFLESENVFFEAEASAFDAVIAHVEFFVDGNSAGLGVPVANSIVYQVVDEAANYSLGTHGLTAQVTDSEGRTSTSAPVNFQIVSESTPGPNALIEFPLPEAVITEPTTIVGAVTSDILASYTLELQLKGMSGWQTIGGGIESVQSEALGTFDPTLLRNGIYDLRLSVTDLTGRTIRDTIPVIVDTGMKVGHFSLAFEDLNIPLSGIPVQLLRSYDSRGALQGDFGPGWDLGVRTVQVYESRTVGEAWVLNVTSTGLGGRWFFEPLNQIIVTVVLGDDQVEQFEAYTEPQGTILGPQPTAAVLKFRPVNGSIGSLTTIDGDIGRSMVNQGGGIYYLDDFGEGPFDPSRWVYTATDGTRMEIEEIVGLRKVTDPNENVLTISEGGITHSNGHRISFTRDTEGRITAITDPEGGVLSYEYDEEGRLRKFTDREGNRADSPLFGTFTEYRYENADTPHYLTSIIDPRGIEAIAGEYDDDGRLIGQTDADGQSFSFEYDIPNKRQTVTDRLGNSTTYYYDELGNVTRQVDATGAETLFEYYPGTTLVKYETDDLGNVTSRAYDSRENLLVEITGALTAEEPLTATTGYITRYTYNEFSSPLTITDPNGNLTEFTYDSRGNLLSQIQHGADGETLTTGFTYTSGGDIASITDAEGNVTSYTYAYGISDAEFPSAVKRQTVTVTDANLGVLRVTESLYDRQENLLVERFDRTLPDGSTETVETSYLYDEDNRLLATFLPDGQVAETRYNSIGKEAASIRWQSLADYQADNLSFARVTTMEYDARGNLVRTVYPDNTETRAGYNLEGRMIWSANQLGEVSAMAYDALGRQTHTVMAAPGDPHADTLAALSWNTFAEMPAALQDNPASESMYDSIGRVEFTIDAVGNVTQNLYDDNCACAGRLKATRSFPDPEDTSVYLETGYVYDANGNQRFVTDPKGNTTEFVYDDFNRLTDTIHPATAEHGVTSTTTEYDSLGRRAATVDEEGKRTAFDYDALGRLVEVRQTDPDHSSLVIQTSYLYDEAGNRLAETDSEGNTTTFEYDRMGRRTKRILPEGQFETYTYNGWGELESRTDFNGHTTTYTYDALGRLLAERADATAFPSEVGITYTYDALGRIETMVDASGTTTYDYDERGNLLTKTNVVGTLTYTYDAGNNLKSTVSGTPGGLNLSYDYDGLNRLEMVTDGGAAQPPLEHRYGYDANGNLETLTYANGVTHTWTYDARNRLKDLSISDVGSQVLESHAFELKATGHRTKITEGSGRVVNYSYDNLYRLTEESITGAPGGLKGTTAWTYDLVGNRLSQTSSLGSLPNLAESYSGNNWLDSHTYDDNGNTVASEISNYESEIVVVDDFYDWRNRLVRRQLSDGTAIEVVYDGHGDRIRKTIVDLSAPQPLTHTTYLVDRNNLTGYAQVVEEYDTSGNLDVIYTYGLDLISQDRRNADSSGEFTQSYYLYDGLGSVRALTDDSGAVTDTYTYDAWGVELASAGSTENAYRFTGEQWDVDLGMYFLRARYLNVETGRFHTMDTFEGVTTDPITLHKYLYANAAPNMWTDPSGKFSLIETVSVGAAIGTLSGLANISYRAVAQNEVFTFRQVLLEQLRNGGVGAVSGGIALKFAAVFQPFVKAGVIGNFGLGTGVATSTGFSTAVINEMIDIFILRKPFSIRDSSGNVLQATVVSFVTGGFITRITAGASRGEQVIRTTPRPGGGFDTSIDVVVGFGDTLRSPAVSATATSTASGELSGGALGFLVEKAVEAVYNFSVGD